MAVYKVPQDVEAEDKFLGPLSFKQFLFFGGTAVLGYLTFLTLSKGVWYFSFVFGLPALAFGMLAFPWSKDQPSELWLAARIRFMFIRRKRIWDQSGMKDLVTITAPKREVHALTDGLTQDEVRVRFNALASVVDSRGWAVKNLSSASARAAVNNSDDRLVTLQDQGLNENENIVNSTNDVMDANSNPLARQFDDMIERSKSKHMQDTLGMIEEARRMSDQGGSGSPFSIPLPVPTNAQSPTRQVAANDLWFINQNQTPADPTLSTFRGQTVVDPSSQGPLSSSATQSAPKLSRKFTITSNDEQAVLNRMHAKKQSDAEFQRQSHLKTIQPIGQQSSVQNNITTPQIDSSRAVDPAILNLAGNDDLTVDTLARQIDRDKPDDNEVVIRLR